MRSILFGLLIALGLFADRACAQAQPKAAKPAKVATVAKVATSVERPNFPCAGCITRVPSLKGQAAPMPLVVVLHGDGGEPSRMVRLLRAEADKRGYLVLAVACPQDRGCAEQSWWRWDGSPAWLVEQVQALAAVWPVDPQRIFVMGWSGGASYLTSRMAEVPSLFSAVALGGGGMPSRADAACALRPAPIFMVSGDQNPLHDLARAARDALRSCHHEVRWVLLHRAGHAAEWLAFERAQVAAMFDFFAVHPTQ
jgi:poly(3-hydroxybutyrate) depolymerase